MTSAYTIGERAPTIAEYRAICTAVGWAAVINLEAAPRSLANSLYHVVALHGAQVIGMGRIVGDGAMYFYLQDIAVVPEYEGHGVGRRIVDRLAAFINANAPSQAFVGLFAAS